MLAVSTTIGELLLIISSGYIDGLQFHIESSEKYWSETEHVVEYVTGGVNFYNIQNWYSYRALMTNKHLTPKYGPGSRDRGYKRHVENIYPAAMTSMMDGVIRRKLKIIPRSVRFGAQSRWVFKKQNGDFMVPVIDIVDRVLALRDLHVIVYSGQMDLIVDTIGTERWVQKLNWPSLRRYNRAPRRHIMDSQNKIMAYTKKYRQLSFFWILNAGHMVPLDAGEASLKMLSMIFNY